MVDSSPMGVQGGSGIRSGFPFVCSNRCRCQSHEGVAVDGGTRKPLSTHGSRRWTGARMECEQKFEQVLEENVAEMGIGELKHEDVKALVQKGTLEAVRETKVKFVLCEESGTGKLQRGVVAIGFSM